MWNDKKNEIKGSDYINFAGFATCNVDCHRAVTDHWGNWRKVKADYNKARPLCKMTEKDKSSFSVTNQPMSLFFLILLVFISKTLI